MRTVISNSDADHTAVTQAYLLANRSVIVKDLYFLGPPIQYPFAVEDSNTGAFPIVDNDCAIAYRGITYAPFAVERGKLTYKIGFEASALQLTVRPRSIETPASVGGSYQRYIANASAEGLNVQPPYYDPYAIFPAETLQPFLNLKQGFSGGDFYLAPFTMTRVFIPQVGGTLTPVEPAGTDTETLGGCVMFRGRVSAVEVDRFEIRLTINSLMQVFQQMVPSQTITPGDRSSAWDFDRTSYSYSAPTISAGGYNWFTGNFSGAPADDALREGWVWIDCGRNDSSQRQGSFYRRIFTNKGSTVYLYEPLPFPITTADAALQVYTAAQAPTVADTPGQGFPYTPVPQTAP